MRVTNIGRTRALVGLETITGGFDGNVPPGQVPTSTGSNGGFAYGSNIGTVTVNGSTQVLGPWINIANGSNTTVTVDQVGSVASNTIRIHATGGAGSFGSNSNAVGEANAPGASSDSSRADHVHLGVRSIAHASNTFSGPVTLTASGLLGITVPTPGTFNFSSIGDGAGGGGSPGSSSDLVPTIIQSGANGANTTSLVVTLSGAALSGERIILAVNSNARDVNTPTCTNVTFTEVLGVAFTTTQFLSIYVGVVSGGSSGTTITITATGSNFIFGEALVVADTLTPTAGVSATLTNTDMSAIQGQMVTIAPAAGTFVIYAAGQGTNATAFTSSMTSAFASRTIRSTNACVMCIAYAPGGSVQGYHLLGSGGADAVIGIVAVT
jgi:hypothetical protein